MPLPRLRFLVVSHAYVIPEHRGKLRSMGQEADVWALVPRTGFTLGDRLPVVEERDAGYRLCPGSTFGSLRTGTRWWFRRSAHLWAAVRPDVVLLEVEPWSLAMLQGLWLHRRHTPQATLVVYAWESLARPGWRAALTRRAYRHVGARARAVMVSSRHTRELFVEAGTPPDRLFVLPQIGVDAERLAPVDAEARAERKRRLGLDPEAFVIGFAGRLVPEKGLLDLAAAVLSLPSSLKARLLVVGAGPLESRLRSMQAEGAPIELRPALPRQAMDGVYQALDVFVLASQTTPTWEEQFGIVLAEAMACGLPVVGSRSGAIPDVIGDAGIVVPERDPDALSAAIVRVAEDSALRTELGFRARSRSARLFTHDALARATIRIAHIARGARRDRPVSYLST